MFIFELFIETVEEFFIFFTLGWFVILFNGLQLLYCALPFNLVIYAVEYDVSSLINLLWTRILEFKFGTCHKLFNELPDALLLILKVLFHVLGSLRIITVALISIFTISSYLLE